MHIETIFYYKFTVIIFIICKCWSTNSNIKTIHLCTTAHNFKFYLYIIEQITEIVKNIKIKKKKKACYRYHREQTDVNMFLL
jgi:hypothetical protein